MDYIIESHDFDKLGTLADKLQGGTDKERDIGHQLWIILQRAIPTSELT